jgi:tetratricopeptide (TPR) repeat protein
MKKTTLICLLAMLFVQNTVWACINGATLTLKNGMYVYSDREEKIPLGHDFVDSPKALKKNIQELERLYIKTKDIDYLSDKGILLIFSKKYQAAIDLYLDIEKQKPNLYNTAANLGTAYELAGQNENALLWIKKAVALNPASHSGSEWLHVKILTAKIKGATAYTSTFLLNTDFGTAEMPKTNLKPAELDKLSDALFYQLNERTSFIKTKEPIVAQLLFDLGNVYFTQGAYYTAEQTYRLAKKYGYNDPLLKKRIALIQVKEKEQEIALDNAKTEKENGSTPPIVKSEQTVVKKDELYENPYFLGGLIAFLVSIVGFFTYKKYKTLSVILLCSLFAQSTYAKDFRYINAVSGVRLRETPDPKGKIIAAIAYREIVELLPKTANLVTLNYTIEGKKGKFVRVEYAKKVGFVFEPFLQDEMPPLVNQSLYVLATSGLRFREKADAKSTVLATVPFGDSLISDGAVDFVAQLESDQSKRLFKVEGISGCWQKAVYKGKKGFVFSGFVSDHHKAENLKDNYVLLEEGWGSSTVVYNQDDYKWYGWYSKKTKTGMKNELKPIAKLFFASEGQGDFDYTLATKTDRTVIGDTALYIIGVRKTVAQQFPLGAIKGVEVNETWISKEKTTYKFKNENWQLSILLKDKPVSDDDGYLDKASLVFESNDKKQKQTIASYDSKNPNSMWFASAQIVWYGDLDGDGKMDLIISKDEDGGSSLELYLSSAAGAGKYLKRVGVLYRGGCC